MKRHLTSQQHFDSNFKDTNIAKIAGIKTCTGPGCKLCESMEPGAKKLNDGGSLTEMTSTTKTPSTKVVKAGKVPPPGITSSKSKKSPLKAESASTNKLEHVDESDLDEVRRSSKSDPDYHPGGQRQVTRGNQKAGSSSKYN